MKRYLLFAFDDYYPSGGWNDFKGSFNDKKQAINEGIKITTPRNYPMRFYFYQVVDTKTGKIISS